jgi:hypothetical protein
VAKELRSSISSIYSFSFFSFSAFQLSAFLRLSSIILPRHHFTATLPSSFLSPNPAKPEPTGDWRANHHFLNRR